MERIRPIKYRPDWSKLPIKYLISKMVEFKLPMDRIRDSNPWCTDEEFEEWKLSEGVLGRDNPSTFSRIVRLPRQHSGHKELDKIFDNFKCDMITVVELPAGTGYPPHRDANRSVNINFIMPNECGTPVAPIIVEDVEYNYDRFVIDVHNQKHSVPSVPVTRLTMMLTYLTATWEEVTEELRANDWL